MPDSLEISWRHRRQYPANAAVPHSFDTRAYWVKLCGRGPTHKFSPSLLDHLVGAGAAAIFGRCRLSINGRHASAVHAAAAGAEGNLRLEQFMRAPYILLAVVGLYLPTFAMAQISLETLRSCLDVEDQTKERLDCYDDKIKPEPKKVSAPAKTAQDCRFLKEEDERLNCFNKFANRPLKKNAVQQKLKKPAADTKATVPAKQ
jgi:hypothetical protein